MWDQNYTPLAGSLPLSALAAAVPVFTLLYLLGVRRMQAWQAALSGLAAAAGVALAVYRMPPSLMFGAAGFGTPVAVAAAMLTGLGFSPFYAAGICLLANTAPVAFGSIGIPVVTLAGVTGLPQPLLSAMVGRLCAMVSVFIPGSVVGAICPPVMP